MGAFRSGQIGVVVASAIILLIACGAARWLGLKDTRTLLRVGVLWLVLMLAFELGAGHYVFGLSWGVLGAEYDLAHRGLLTLGMIVLVFAPLIAARWRGLN